jgi:excisionase family DNA binding protein
MNNKHNYNRAKLRYNKDLGSAMHSQEIFQNDITNKIVDENDRWLTSKEAASYLSISTNALRILVHRARVKTYKLGNHLRFRKSDLFEVLQLKED